MTGSFTAGPQPRSGDRHGSRGGGFGVEHRAVAQHGAGDAEEPVGDRAQRSRVAVAAIAQRLVAGLLAGSCWTATRAQW